MSADKICFEAVAIKQTERQLNGTLFVPQGSLPPRAAVVLNGATGVPHSFYKNFAQWLAKEQNLACLVYDYSDFGASLSGSMRKSHVSMVAWGVEDQQVARDWLAMRFPDCPLWVIGHSLGGLMLPFQQRLDQIDRVITVASGPVNIRDHPWPYQILPRIFWYLNGPLLTALFGYLPGKLSGLGQDLPRNVYFQWRRWCTSRGFYERDIDRLLPTPDWEGLKAQMKIVAVADDPMVPPSAVWRLMEFYQRAHKRQLTLKPEKFGLSKVGHIGAFARQCSPVWEAIIA